METGLTQVKWLGTTPGADAFTYLLFATTLLSTDVNDGTHKDYDKNNMNAFNAWGARSFAYLGIRKVVLSLKNSQAGTLIESYLTDRATGAWRTVSSPAIGIPAAGFDTEREFLVESYPDWKLEWANGGVAQVGWDPTLALTNQRAVP